MIRHSIQYSKYTGLLRKYTTATCLRQDYQCFREGPIYNENMVELVFIDERLYTMFLLKYAEYL